MTDHGIPPLHPGVRGGRATGCLRADGVHAVPGARPASDTAPVVVSRGGGRTHHLPHQRSPLTGRHVLLVSGRMVEADGPGVNALAVRLERVAAQVSVLPSGSVVADLLGRRVIGRPDLVVAFLPGRGPSLAAITARLPPRHRTEVSRSRAHQPMKAKGIA